MADYYYLPPGHYAYKVPDELPSDAVPPVNCALSQVLFGLERAKMDFGDTVVIQGAGGLGIFATAIASEKGASKVIVIDGQQPRLGFGDEVRRYRHRLDDGLPYSRISG